MTVKCQISSVLRTWVFFGQSCVRLRTQRCSVAAPWTLCGHTAGEHKGHAGGPASPCPAPCATRLGLPASHRASPPPLPREDFISHAQGAAPCRCLGKALAKPSVAGFPETLSRHLPSAFSPTSSSMVTTPCIKFSSDAAYPQSQGPIRRPRHQGQIVLRAR